MPTHICGVNGCQYETKVMTNLKQHKMSIHDIDVNYYQCNIPIKDCALMSRMKDPELRRRWRKRILDHDGSGVTTSGESSDKEYFKQKLNNKDEGGIERWLLWLSE